MGLEFYNAAKIDNLVWPENYREISQDSPCLNVFTDFKVHRPLTIEPSTRAYLLEELMLRAHVRLKFVVDEGGDFLGVVALEDIQHPDFLMRIAAVYTRDSLMVTDVMRPKSALNTLAFADIEQATVGEVIHFLQDYTYQHCLVIDTNSNRVRGLISVSDIARRLKIKIRVHDSPSFAELYLQAKS
jgi:CBS domain containing-hemolysin-like protein